MFLATQTLLFAQDIWPMKGHDTRRTGQSLANGPREVTDYWVSEVPAAFVLNIGATVTEEGAFFGSWGLLRNDSLGRDVRFWDKSDGKLYGLDLSTGTSLWSLPLDLDVVHRCYEFEGRERTGDDLLWCGFTPYKVSFYNGTIEGQGTYDIERHLLYLGRGDGKLYAIDTEEGAIVWRYRTFNPELPDDPDGGGEIISAPLVGEDGTIYFGTWGVGPYETNAFYAIKPDSSLLWRFPADSSLTGRPIFTSPALSPDRSTIYFGTFYQGSKDIVGKLYALNLSPQEGQTDDQRLKWQLELKRNGVGVWTTTLAVGSDGVIYIGGLTFAQDGITSVPVLLALEDSPGGPVPKWSPEFLELSDGAQWVGGIALRETEGETRRLYAVTANFRPGVLLPNQKDEGSLFAVDKETGTVAAVYDPSEDVPSAVGGLNSPAIGADGLIYFGVRGKFETNTVQAVNGHVFAVEYNDASTAFEKKWNFEVDGHLEWNHPAIGPDGGIYIASSVGAFGSLTTYDPGEIPANTTCKFYGIKGPKNPLSVEAGKGISGDYRIVQNYPNPFNPGTTIRFRVSDSRDVTLEIYNLLGQRIRALYEGKLIQGAHEIEWNGADDRGNLAPGGIYIFRMRTGNIVVSKKLLLMR